MKRFVGHIILLIIGCLTSHISAYNSDVYRNHSVLSSGRWVKIGVTETGFHYIPEKLLTKWGFASSKDVRIFGYGCLSETDNSNKTIIDDLPQISTADIDGGILFFAVGPVKPTLDQSMTPGITTHPYTTHGYYFLTEDSGQPLEFPVEYDTDNPTNNDAETYNVAWHQSEIFSPGETGQLLVGEDFMRQPTQAITISTPDADSKKEAVISTKFLANSINGSSTLKIGVDGETKSFVINQTDNPQYDFGKLIEPTVKTKIQGDNTVIKLSHSSSGQPIAANLDYIAIAHPCKISDNNTIFFSKGGKLNHSTQLLFDVTDPQKVTRVITPSLRQSLLPRCYQFIANVKKLPSPSFESEVSNQDIHADLSLPQMIIVTPKKWKNQATRLAKLHTDENIQTTVLSSEQIYNEFSSGRFDPSAIRNCLKMYYDRGQMAGQPLKYALLFGRGVYDNRQLTAECKKIDYPLLPTWQSESSLNDVSSFTTDDYFAILNDKRDTDLLNDTLSIAVGRISITSATEAQKIVEKIIDYVNNPKPGEWKNKILMLADDGDSGCHIRYAENMIDQMKQSGGDDVVYSKLYLDSYEKSNGTYPEARKRLETELNNGVGWWTFIGHAGQTTLTADKLVTYNDIVNLNISTPPAMLAFTCDFLRCDNHDISGGELLLNNREGGVIAIISATRPVNLNQNGELASSFGSVIYHTTNNHRLTIGEIFQRAKNKYHANNKLRYILLGDPAIKISTIDNKIAVKTINDIQLSDQNQPTIGALSRMTIEGIVSQDNDTPHVNFNGNITTKIYDATTSVTTNGNDSDGVKSVYDTEGQILYAGTDTVLNGKFKTTAIIPAEITGNFRNATIQLYAIDTKTGNEATGRETRFYIYGEGDGITDTIIPKIETFYLNRPSFKSGDVVDSSPTIYITVTDDSSLDISTSSNHNQMLLKLDENPLPDLALYYSPISSVNAGGTIVYPLQALENGRHTLTFEVSDIAGNRAQKSIDFITKTNLATQILEIYTDTQPAIDKANFYIDINRPNETINVTLQIFDIKGNLLWETTRQDRGDRFKSNPVNWNLTDRSGRRIARGIYIYRFIVEELNGMRTVSRANKIAVGK